MKSVKLYEYKHHSNQFHTKSYVTLLIVLGYYKEGISSKELILAENSEILKFM